MSLRASQILQDVTLAEIVQIIIIVLGTLVGFTIAGVVGFGGGIVVLPILVSIVGMQEAVPILTISQLSSNFSRVWIHRQNLNWKVFKYFAVGSVPFAILEVSCWSLLIPQFWFVLWVHSCWDVCYS